MSVKVSFSFFHVKPDLNSRRLSWCDIIGASLQYPSPYPEGSTPPNIHISQLKIVVGQLPVECFVAKDKFYEKSEEHTHKRPHVIR